MGFILVNTLIVSYSTIISQTIPIDRLKNAGHYLETRLQNSDNKIVLNTSIDSYHELFYHTQNVSFFMGLDINFFNTKYIDILKGYFQYFKEGKEHPSDFMKKYKIKYIHLDRKYSPLIAATNCLRDNHLFLCYLDNDSMVFETAID
ncbi:MAG: hypothetical protein AB1656_17465 [Candidatus Omnitrophota bacterium]